MDRAVAGPVPYLRDAPRIQVMVDTMRTRDADALRRRNLRTGWVLGGVALLIALSVWYARLG